MNIFIVEIGYILAFFLFSYLNIYIHELGHVLAGLLVKFSITRVSIGVGREIVRKKIGNILFIITDRINGGVTYIGQVSHHFLKLRYFVYILGGVAAQIIAVIVIMFVFRLQTEDIIKPNSISLVHLFIYSNLISVITNLIPRKVNILGIKLQTDGLQILKLPFLKSYEIQEILSAGKIMEAYECLENKEFEQAEDIFRNCIKTYPNLLIPKANFSVALIKQLKLDETIQNLESLIKKNTDTPYFFLIYNNLAWTYFIQLTEQSLHKADKYSSQAFDLNSKSPNINGTRGCILIEKGDIDSGIKLLKKFVNLNQSIDEKTNNLITFLYLAYGYYLQNKLKKANQYFKKIKKYRQKSHRLTLDKDYQILFDHILNKTNYFEKLLT